MRGLVSGATGAAWMATAWVAVAGGASVDAGVLDQVNKELVGVVQAVRPSVVAVEYPHHVPGMPTLPHASASGVAVAEDHVVTVGLRPMRPMGLSSNGATEPAAIGVPAAAVTSRS